nr:DUF2920 family protein [Campylobacter jejuni]
MAAIDHINALKDLVKRFPKFADLPKIYGGGVLWRIPIFTHSKIAPWYVDGVIDNSVLYFRREMELVTVIIMKIFHIIGLFFF